MNDAESEAYRIAGEVYGRLRNALTGGRLTMAYEASVGNIDYRWSFMRQGKKHTVNQSVDLTSLSAADEVESLCEAMVSGLNMSAKQCGG